ncbi:hypothetical protein CO655_14650 [Rhizobium sp. M1]|nr:hypothetical protein CO655_14650 [Rhizobium sp. M1]
MRLGSIFHYAQVVVVALLVAAPFGMAAGSSAVETGHCPVTVEHHRDSGHVCGQQAACCSTTHCCPMLPELAAVETPRLERGRHERTPSDSRPLLLIRAIDPPPRNSAA